VQATLSQLLFLVEKRVNSSSESENIIPTKIHFNIFLVDVASLVISLEPILFLSMGKIDPIFSRFPQDTLVTRAYDSSSLSTDGPIAILWFVGIWDSSEEDEEVRVTL